MKVEIDLPVIEGYEYTGEYRRAEIDEPYECNGVRILHAPKATTHSYHILKKKAPKYKTITPASYLQESGYIDFSAEYVEIKALEDAIKIIDTLAGTSGFAPESLIALKALIK